MSRVLNGATVVSELAGHLTCTTHPGEPYSTEGHVMKRLLGLVAATTLSLAAAMPVWAAAVPTPVETGCAAGFEQLSVQTLTALGYRLPSELDAAGNQDGWVCGHAFVEAAKDQLCPDCPREILYLFGDNDVPAYG
jgi:hypothetical protein